MPGRGDDGAPDYYRSAFKQAEMAPSTTRTYSILKDTLLHSQLWMMEPSSIDLILTVWTMKFFSTRVINVSMMFIFTHVPANCSFQMFCH